MKNTKIEQLLGQIEEQDLGRKPVVVAYGLMNSGKSSLLNMLTGHVGQDFFKTADVRETVENKAFEGDRYIYLDTPGLDADAADDAQAAAGVDQADVVLFVHQPQGELEANELTFLCELGASFGSYGAQHIAIVLTKKEKETAAKIDEIEQRIRQQCERALGYAPQIFQVSNKRYQNGLLNGKDALVMHSQIPAVLAYLNEMAGCANAPRVQRAQVKIDALLDEVEKAEQKLLTEKERVCARIIGGFSSFNRQIEELHSFLDLSASDFQRI